MFLSDVQAYSLFSVQDSDRPMFVLAENCTHALAQWRQAIAIENECEADAEPNGIQLVCESGDLLTPGALTAMSSQARRESNG